MSSSAVTLLDVVNKILIRLRDQAVLSITSTTTATGGAPSYTDTIVRLLNDAKREVEDSFDWIGLQESITITTTSGTSSYDLENSSQGIYTNQRSRVLDVYNTTCTYIHMHIHTFTHTNNTHNHSSQNFTYTSGITNST